MSDIKWRDVLFVFLYGVSYLLVYSFLLNYFENEIISIIILIGGLFLLPWSLAVILSKIVRTSKHRSKDGS